MLGLENRCSGLQSIRLVADAMGIDVFKTVR